MAERRMFSKTIIDSDKFTDMPLSTQALYFHLSMRADDDGFVNNPKKIQRMIGCADDDFKLLILKSFVIGFESGVIVIKHWRMHNYIQKDRYKETIYSDEKRTLQLKDGREYVKNDDCIQNGYTMDTQVSIGKVSLELGKDSIVKDSIELNVESDDSSPAKPTKHKYGEYKNVLLTDEELDKLKNEFPDYEQKIENLSSYIESKGAKYKSHLATIRNWAKKDSVPQKGKTAQELDSFYGMAKSWAERNRDEQ